MVKLRKTGEKVKKSRKNIKAKVDGGAESTSIEPADQVDEEKNECNSMKTTELSALDIARLEKILRFDDADSIEFSKSQWLSLSFEDKCLLPLFISRQFRTSSTAAEKKLHNKQKRELQAKVLKYKNMPCKNFT